MGMTNYVQSLATRVLVCVAVAVLVCAALIAGSLQHSIEQHFAEQDAGELNAVAQSLNQMLKAQTTALTEVHHQHGSLPADRLEQVLTGHHEAYYLITDEQGAPLYQSPQADLSPLLQLSVAKPQIQPSDLVSYQQQNRTFRGAIYQGSHGHQIVVAMAMEFHLHYLHLLSVTLWCTMLGAVILIVLAGWFAVRQGLKPLALLTQQLHTITTHELDQRLDPSQVPTELRPLVHSVNLMIGRLERGFDQLTHFSADIAHELRTPLSNLITQTQVALSQPRTEAQYQELLYSNLEEQERLNRMVSDMLWLAKSDHGLIQVQQQPVQLADEIPALLEFFQLLADEKSIQLCFDSHPVPALLGEREMLKRAISNLLSNAIRHATPGSNILLTLSPQAPAWWPAPLDGWLWLSICNTGESIPEELQHRLFDRFFRADPSRQRHSEGAGLGLALVQSIVQLHGGQIAVRSVEGSTCFSIGLPAHTSADSVVEPTQLQ